MAEEKGRALPAKENSHSGENKKPPPWIMYVHHLPHDHQPQYDVYLFQLAAEKSVAEQLPAAVDAILGGKAVKVPAAPAPDGVEWRVPSYAAFVLVSPTRTITTVDFTHEGKPHPHAFKLAGSSEVPGQWSALIFENKRKDKGEGDLNGREILFWKADHTMGSARKDTRILSHTSSDTNVGP